jgi:phospholipase C
MRQASLVIVVVGLLSLMALSGCGGAAGSAGTTVSNGNGSNNGGDTGTGGTSGTGGTNTGGGTTNTPPPPADITAVNHVLIMLQENRSFDSYFWNMTNYRNANGIPINSNDGKIRDGSDPAAANLAANGIKPYHTGSQCTEDLTPDWHETHLEMDLGDPAHAGPGSPMNGFVNTARGLSQYLQVLDDTSGHRAMGYFDETQLNYYYFMASTFAMGDMFFSPNPSRTSANRLFIHAATSDGYAHPDTTLVTQANSKTIWAELDAAGVSWKFYLSDWDPTNPTAASSCPLSSTSNKCFTFFRFFTDYNTLVTNSKTQHVFSIDQYFTDVQNGTLPAVAFIEAGMQTGRDEHPTNNLGPDIAVPQGVAIRVQSGAAWVSKIVNALMTSPSWKDSVFFFTFDEGGGAFDHVPAISVPNPDGIKPRDLDEPKDCFNVPCNSPLLDFIITGFRVPNFIVSPFAKKNYVSHTPMDYTAILKFVETRLNLPPLNRRDGIMPDMTEFFDFAGVPWATPPPLCAAGSSSSGCVPVQRQDAPCNFSKE